MSEFWIGFGVGAFTSGLIVTAVFWVLIRQALS